jgi:hypothetical protein
MRHRRIGVRAAGVAAVIVSVLVAGALPAGAGQASEVTLLGKGPTFWDATNDTSSCNTSTAFSPVDDGEYDGQTDAFDGGLTINVNGTDFVDADDALDLAGDNPVELITTAGVGGKIRVTRMDAALSTSPTLRSLIAFRNNNAKGRTLTVLWDSNLGSDSSEAVRADSSGNTAYGLNDRWVISSDDATTPSDPVLTFVLFGRRAAERPSNIVDNFGGGCFGIEFEIRVPGKSTRYLLLFTQMNGTNEQAISRSGAFDRLGRGLLRGISDSVRDRILNGNL